MVLRLVPYVLGLTVIVLALWFLDRHALKTVDWGLLATFAAFFTFSGNLLVGVNVGGAGTLVASLASLITFREYTRCVPDGGKSFFLLFSGISFAFLAILLTAMSVLGW